MNEHPRSEYFCRARAKLEVIELPAEGLEQRLINAAALCFRGVLVEVVAGRDEALVEPRAAPLPHHCHAMFMCRDAVQDGCTFASGSRLDNPIQRAMRDVTTAANHVIFDRESRYADYGRMRLGQPIRSPMA